MRPAAGDRWKDDDDYDYDHDHDQGERMKTDWQQRRRGDEEEQLRGSRGARQKRGRAPSESVLSVFPEVRPTRGNLAGSTTTRTDSIPTAGAGRRPAIGRPRPTAAN